MTSVVVSSAHFSAGRSRRHRRWLALGLAFTLIAGLAVVPSAARANEPPAPAEPEPGGEVAAAIAAAAASGERVEVMSERTELTQVFAEPDGVLTYEAAAVPQRVRRADGSWADIDVTLRPGPDGRLRPVASTADVTFSAGGDGPLASMTRDGATFTLSWPGGALPTPVVSGDSATYPEVLPGVDLVARATESGFSHVLVVKTPEAAASAAVRQVRFEVGGDVALSHSIDGTLQATAGSRLVASAEPPAMWDSATLEDSAAMAGQALGAAAEPSTHAAPGDAARVAPVLTEVTADGDLVLRSDETMLTSPDTTFPVYIDPLWDTGKKLWAYATDNDSNNNDLSVARVGRDPNGSRKYRSFFQFPTSAIKGKYVHSAYVQMKLDHSYSCGNTPTSMYHASVPSSTPRTPWKTTKLLSWLASAQSHANEGSGCSDSPQPDMIVNFRDSSSDNRTVTSLVQSTANNGHSTLTVGFCACSAESDKTLWKKFFPNSAKLIAEVDAKPGKPVDLQVSGVACTSTGITVGTLTPRFSAKFPDADNTQSIRGTWELLEVPASGTWNDSTPRLPAPPPSSAAANSRGETPYGSELVSEKQYAVRVKGKDPAPYNQESPWSDWCVFRVDTTVPPVTVAPTDLPDGPGKPVSLTITSTALDVVTFRYGWTEAVTSQVTPTTVELADPGGPSRTVKAATVTLTAPRYGTNIVYVQAIDATGNRGYGSTEFVVDRPSPAVARWALQTYPGFDQAAALADQQPTLAGNTPLTTTNVTWTDDVRLLGGQTPSFDGSSSQASTTSGDAVIDPTQSFSVAAWVKLGNVGDPLPAANRAAVTQNGVHNNSFVLGYRRDGGWGFWMHTTDDAGSRETGNIISQTPAVTGVWTHLAAAYDALSGTATLFVNGQPQGSATVAGLGDWAARQQIGVGFELWQDAIVSRWSGGIADVQIFDRVLVPHDFTGQLAEDPGSGGFDEPGILEPILVGQWDFDVMQPCYDEPSWFNECVALPADNWGRRLRFTMGTDVDGGRRGAGALLDGTHWAGEGDPYHGRATFEYGVAQQTPDEQEWLDTAVLNTDQSFTVSVWLRPDVVTGEQTRTAVSQQGNLQSSFYLGTRMYTVDGVPQTRWAVAMTGRDEESRDADWATASLASRPLSDEDTAVWTHVVAVYDAQRAQLRLYVNGSLAGERSRAPVYHAGGPFTVGAARHTPDHEQPRLVDAWLGGIDDLMVFQGAMTDAQVRTLYEQQSLSAL